MATKSNPQITIPRATFDELQAIADVWGLPSPGLVVPMMVKQFGHLMKGGIVLPTSTADYSNAVDSTAVYSEPVESTALSRQALPKFTDIYSIAVKTTADYSKPVETTANETPANAFLDMDF
jgi:hypothetical protein